MQIKLTVVEGPHQGREFTFREHDNFIVGRAKCAHFRLPMKDKHFSRVHFMIEVILEVKPMPIQSRRKVRQLRT
jgi:hypothetical protein